MTLKNLDICIPGGFDIPSLISYAPSVWPDWFGAPAVIPAVPSPVTHSPVSHSPSAPASVTSSPVGVTRSPHPVPRVSPRPVSANQLSSPASPPLSHHPRVVSEIGKTSIPSPVAPPRNLQNAVPPVRLPNGNGLSASGVVGQLHPPPLRSPPRSPPRSPGRTPVGSSQIPPQLDEDSTGNDVPPPLPDLPDMIIIPVVKK